MKDDGLMDGWKHGWMDGRSHTCLFNFEKRGHTLDLEVLSLRLC